MLLLLSDKPSIWIFKLIELKKRRRRRRSHSCDVTVVTHILWNIFHRARTNRGVMFRVHNFFFILEPNGGEDNTDEPPGRFAVEWGCSLGHLGFHGLRGPLRSSLPDLLQKIVDLEAERLDLFVPRRKRLTGWEGSDIRINVWFKSV